MVHYIYIYETSTSLSIDTKWNKFTLMFAIQHAFFFNQSSMSLANVFLIHSIYDRNGSNGWPSHAHPYNNQLLVALKLQYFAFNYRYYHTILYLSVTFIKCCFFRFVFFFYSLLLCYSFYYSLFSQSQLKSVLSAFGYIGLGTSPHLSPPTPHSFPIEVHLFVVGI